MEERGEKKEKFWRVRESSRKRIVRWGGARERREIVSRSEEAKRNQREKSVRKGRKERDSQSFEERAETEGENIKGKEETQRRKGLERWGRCSKGREK